MITRSEIIESTKNRNVFVIKNFYNEIASWKEIDELYDIGKNTEDIQYVSFATMAIRNASSYTEIYNDLINKLSQVHNGQCLGAMSIIHFVSSTNNRINDPDAIRLRDKFNHDNPHDWPNHLIVTEDGVTPKENFEPTIHSDAADGFFIQGDGETLWRIYDENDNIRYTHTLSRGDFMYIPKDIRHSVESLCPRHAVSIAFSDYNFN
jgi:hypothetical protein